MRIVSGSLEKLVLASTGETLKVLGGPHFTGFVSCSRRIVSGSTIWDSRC